MLKKLTIKNFQSHKKTELELSPGLNVIQGQSQAGKTAILRAFELLRTYRPLGYRFHNTSSKDPVKIEVQVDDGRKITLEKTKTEGKYSIPDDNFSHVGSTVPPEVSEILSMEDINIQRQLDPYFLLTDTPGQVARVFNDLMGINMLDPAITELTSRINSVGRSIKENETLLSDKREELSRLAYVDEVKEIVNQLEKWDEEENRIVKQQADLEAFLGDIKEIEQDISQLEKWLEIEDKLPSIEALIEREKRMRDEETHLTSIKRELVALEKEEKKFVYLDELEKSVNDCLSLWKDADSLSSEKQLLLAVTEVQEQIDSLDEELLVMKKGYTQEIKKKKTCPLCGNILTDKGLKKVLEEM